MKARGALVVLVLALVGAVIAAVFGLAHRTAPVSPVEQVPTTWTDAREAPMHVLHVGKQKIACTECHATPDAAPTTTACGRCHEQQTKRHHRGSAQAPTTCTSCHVFGANVVAATCNDCHAAEQRAAGAPALEHHASKGLACSSCHRVHGEERAVSADCSTCHADVSARHGALAARTTPPGQVCTACHAPHTGKEAARACKDCHADHAAVSAVEGHATCTGCHAPHAPGGARSSCTTTCHANVSVLGAPRVAAHASCASCHDPHRPDVSAGRSCVRCHEGVKPSHPPVASARGEQACTGCHAPHGSRGPRVDVAVHAAATPIAASCSTCHTSAKDDHAFHTQKTACTDCHTPHAFRLEAVDAALCARCHGAQAKAAAAGHASCTSCHGDAHAPIAKTACAACHAGEASTAPRGHAVCTSCHESHSGALGSRASCTGCHEEKGSALHANVAQGCKACHRPHALKGPAAAAFFSGDSPRACGTCHAKPSLKGLHAVGGHATCGTCHSAHGPPRSDRATCTTSCHADRRSHQPEARVCKGCHLFTQ